MNKTVCYFLIFLIFYLPAFSQNKYPNGNAKDFEADAPWRVRSSDQTIPFSVLVKDADSDGVYLESVSIYLQSGSSWNLIHQFDFNSEWLENPHWEYIYEVTPANLGLSAGTDAYFKIELVFDEGWYWPEETFTKGFKVTIGDTSFPALPGWIQGDTHVHSTYTDNLYEFGSSLDMLSKSSEAMGLDFCFITDHSCDFDASGTLFAQQASDINSINQSSNCVLIQGEEVTVDKNWTDESPDDKIHFLVFGNSFVRGPENPEAFTTDTSSQLKKLSAAAGEIVTGIGYAAHPFDAMESWGASATIGNLSEWSQTCIDSALLRDKFRGLQLWNQKQLYIKDLEDNNMWPFPWNDNPDTDLTAVYQQHLDYVMAKWQQILTDNLSPLRKLYIAGGSDAHGDINYQTYLEISLGNNILANSSRFAEVRTAVYCPGGPGPGGINVISALNNGSSIVTDGPVLSFFIDRNRDGIINGTDAIIGQECRLSAYEISEGTGDIVIDYLNTSEFGGNINMIRLVSRCDSLILGESYGFAPSASGRIVISLSQLSDFLDPDSTGAENFLRIEAFTGSLFRCYTNPLWIKIYSGRPELSIECESGSLNRILTWTAFDDAVSYRVYSSENPYSAFPSEWTLEADNVTALTWTDTSPASVKKFYILTAGF